MKRAISMILIFSMLFATGCWDRVELNDLGIELGWGLDSAPNREVETSAQIVIPAKMKAEGGGGAGKPYFVVSGIGKTTLDAAQHMQASLSRRVLRSHRRAIFIGEPLARRGLKDVLDTYVRDPQVRMRTDVFVTENSTAKKFLKIPYPLESIPASGALKEHTAMGGFGDLVLLDFMINASAEGSSPTLPIMKTVTENPDAEETNSFAYGGRAIFNQDLKMVGAVPPYEAQLMFWVKNANKYLDIADFIPQGKGEVTLDVTKPKSKIIPTIKGNQVKFRVVLIGKGVIRSANIKFDLRNRKYLKVVQSVMERDASKQVAQVISKVQKEYGADVFGFGESIHRKYPYQWKKMKKNWGEEFKKSDISVETHLTIERAGLTGPPLQLKANEVER
jgi:spore germination protein KC